MRTLLVVGTVLLGCARDLSILTRIRSIAAEPPAVCSSLGEVSGRAGGYTAQESEARYKAWKEADEKGATHVRVNPTEVDRTYVGVAAYVVSGTAYRCPPGVEVPLAK